MTNPVWTSEQCESEDTYNAYWLQWCGAGGSGCDYDVTIRFAQDIDDALGEDRWMRSVLPVPSPERLAALEELAKAVSNAHDSRWLEMEPLVAALKQLEQCA